MNLKNKIKSIGYNTLKDYIKNAKLRTIVNSENIFIKETKEITIDLKKEKPIKIKIKEDGNELH